MNQQPLESLKSTETENVKCTDAKGLWCLNHRSIAGGQNVVTCSSLYGCSIHEIILTEKTREYHTRNCSGTP